MGESMNDLQLALAKHEATRLRFKILGIIFGVISVTSPIWSLPFARGQSLAWCILAAVLLLVIALIFRGLAVSARNAGFQTRVWLAFNGAMPEQLAFFAGKVATCRRRGFIFGFSSLGFFGLSTIISTSITFFSATTHEFPLGWTAIANPISLICQIMFPVCGVLGLSSMAGEIRARKFGTRLSQGQSSAVSPE